MTFVTGTVTHLNIDNEKTKMIEAIAFAHIKEKMPEQAYRCKNARIEFKDGKFYVSFSESVDALTF